MFVFDIFVVQKADVYDVDTLLRVSQFLAGIRYGIEFLAFCTLYIFSITYCWFTLIK